mgnify:CR=1 FL=1
MQPTRLAQVAAYQSPWLKAEDLQGRAAAVVVEAATVEEIRQPDGKKEGRVVVAFRGKAKKLILNKTQAEALVALAKSDVFADWVGLSLTLEPATASFSRAVHSLFDKGLICGLALAWIYVEKDTSGAWKADDLWAYAGPGRKTDESPPGSKYADLQKPPVLSRVGLTSLGWWIVHQDNPEEGLCPLCKQIVERDGYPTPDD